MADDLTNEVQAVLEDVSKKGSAASPITRATLSDGRVLVVHYANGRVTRAGFSYPELKRRAAEKRRQQSR